VRVSITSLHTLGVVSLEFVIVVELILVGERLSLEVVVVFELVFALLVLFLGLGSVLPRSPYTSAISLVSV
jgi:hypothetical protein